MIKAGVLLAVGLVFGAMKMTKKSISKKGIDLLIQREGVELMVYRDSANLRTIGVGHLLTGRELESGYVDIGGKKVPWRQEITEYQAEVLLKQDLKRFENAVNEYVNVALTQHQFDSLVSFVFNIGVNAFKNSTLLRLLNQGDYESVPGQLERWNRAGGQVVTGLIHRRNSEIDQFRGVLA